MSATQSSILEAPPQQRTHREFWLVRRAKVLITSMIKQLDYSADDEKFAIDYLLYVIGDSDFAPAVKETTAHAQIISLCDASLGLPRIVSG